MAIFEQAEFWRAAHSLGDLPPPDLPEIAFAGRSNAGKSSAINALARRRRLAFTSKTPGRTREIVFFTIPGLGYLVDLPGYGYAKVPNATRVHWEGVLSGYLQTRESLRGMALIMDVRHPLTDLDQRMIDWFAPTGRPILVLLTKADKLTRTDARDTLSDVRKALSVWGPQCTAQLFSSFDRSGVEEAEETFAAWLGVPPRTPVNTALPDEVTVSRPPGEVRRHSGKPGRAAKAERKKPRAKGDGPGAKRLN